MRSIASNRRFTFAMVLFYGAICVLSHFVQGAMAVM
jgi:hypothetical protein